MSLPARRSLLPSIALLLAACHTPSVPASGAIAGLDLARLQPRTDRFTVLMQGTPRGSQQCQLTRTDEGWLYTETTTIPPMLQQTTEVWLDASGQPRRVRQRGEMGGKPMRIDATYANGRVLADAVTPSAPTPVHSDQALPTGTLDDNALQALLPALRCDAALGLTLPVFATGKGQALAARLERIGGETVATKTGPVPASRIRVTIGEAQQDFVVADAAPYAILQMNSAGAPFVLQRDAD